MARDLLLSGVRELLESFKASARINQLSLMNLQTMHQKLHQNVIHRESSGVRDDNSSGELAAPDVLLGKQHNQAKYDFREATGGMEGLRDIADNVEDAKDDAERKAHAVAHLVQFVGRFR